MDEEIRAALSVQQKIQLDAMQHQELRMLRDRVLHEAMIRHEIASFRQQGGILSSHQLEAVLSAQDPMQQQRRQQQQHSVQEVILVESLLRRKKTLEDHFAATNSSSGSSVTQTNTVPVADIAPAAALLEQTLLLQQLQDQEQKQRGMMMLRFPQQSCAVVDSSFAQRKQRHLLQPSFSMVAEKPLGQKASVSFQNDNVVEKMKPMVKRQPPFKKRKISAMSHQGNSFPLPSLKDKRKEDDSNNNKDPTTTTALISYQRLWGKLGNSRFQDELFRRKLAAGTVSLTGRTRSPIVLLKRETMLGSSPSPSSP
jgi:hypothetical protein